MHCFSCYCVSSWVFVRVFNDWQAFSWLKSHTCLDVGLDKSDGMIFSWCYSSDRPSMAIVGQILVVW
jgi:hypothetical protein